MVGNGQHLECTRWCEAVSVDIQATTFTIDLYVLPILGANIVLGFQWLKSLGPVLTDYNTLCMKFFHDGRLVELKGDNESTLNLLALPQFRRLLKKQGASFYYHITVISDEVNSDHSGDPSPVIQALITQFNALRGRLTIIFTCFPSLLRERATI